MAKYPKFKAYFYNGFNKPKLVATCITNLERDVKLHDNYLGDMTSELKDEIKAFKQGKQSFDDLKNSLLDMNILIDPTFKEVVEYSKQWFGNAIPYHHFVDIE